MRRTLFSAVSCVIGSVGDAVTATGRTGVILSGGNIAPADFAALLDRWSG